MNPHILPFGNIANPQATVKENFVPFSDLRPGLANEKIDNHPDPETPRHVGQGQCDAGNEKSNEELLVWLEASDERAELQSREHEKHSEDRVGNKGEYRETELSAGESQEHKKKLPIITSAAPVLAPKR